jgi:hypothetical protein
MVALAANPRKPSTDIRTFHERWSEVVGCDDDPHLPSSVIRWFFEQLGIWRKAAFARTSYEMLLLHRGIPRRIALTASWSRLEVALLVTCGDRDSRRLHARLDKLIELSYDGCDEGVRSPKSK